MGFVDRWRGRIVGWLAGLQQRAVNPVGPERTMQFVYLRTGQDRERLLTTRGVRQAMDAGYAIRERFGDQPVVVLTHPDQHQSYLETADCVARTAQAVRMEQDALRPPPGDIEMRDYERLQQKLGIGPCVFVWVINGSHLGDDVRDYWPSEDKPAFGLYGPPHASAWLFTVTYRWGQMSYRLPESTTRTAELIWAGGGTE